MKKIVVFTLTAGIALALFADELPNSLEAEISGGNQLIMNYEQAQELFGIKFRRWLGIFNL